MAGEADWSGKGPYGLPFLRDDAGEIRPGNVLMPAGGGDFWKEIGQHARGAASYYSPTIGRAVRDWR